jgi:hypothetical protein
LIPHDFERTAYGDEAGGPTMADLNYSVHGSAGELVYQRGRIRRAVGRYAR